MSTPAILIFLRKVSITSSELYVEVSEKDQEFWSLDPAVLRSCDHLHGRSVLSTLPSAEHGNQAVPRQ